MLLDRHAGLLDVGTHGDRHEWAEIVVGQAPFISALREAGIEVRLEQIEPLRVHENGKHAVRHLSGVADARRCDGCRIYLHIWIAVDDAFERLAQSGRVRTLLWGFGRLSFMGPPG